MNLSSTHTGVDVSLARDAQPCYSAGMAETLTIRLEDRDREVLEAAARRRGSGLSAFVRELAEAEAERLRKAAIRSEGERVLVHLAEHPEARAELDAYGTPPTEIP